MKQCRLLFAAFLMLALAAGAGAADEKEKKNEKAPKTMKLQGWVSDSHCGAQHAMEGQQEEVKKCLKSGNRQDGSGPQMVFVADKTKAGHPVMNPDALYGQEGKHLEIRAEPYGDANGLLVLGVEKDLAQTAKK
jgi:hypothetical protein